MSSCSRKTLFTSIVLGAHFVLLMTLLIHHGLSNHPIPSKIVVHNRSLQTTSVQTSSVIAKEPPKKKQGTQQRSAPSTKAAQVSKETSATVKKQGIASKKKEELEALWKELDSFASPSFSSSSIDIPSQVSAPIEEEASYEEILIGYLQNVLELPERGEVKVNLTINGAGKLLNLEIVAMKNPKNGEFLKKRLSELVFPQQTEKGLEDAVFQCTVVFKNRS